MMGYLIVGLMIMAVWHFVWEMIIAPSLRMSYRSNLFAIRDRLRRLKIERPDEVSDKLFDQMESSLNFFINNLHKITLSWCIAMMRYTRQADKADVDEVRSNTLDSHLPEVQKMHRDIVRVIDRTFMANAGGWALYLLPLFFAVKIYSETRKLLQPIVLRGQNDLERIFSGDLIRKMMGTA